MKSEKATQNQEELTRKAIAGEMAIRPELMDLARRIGAMSLVKQAEAMRREVR